jgi:hypothetical protein
MPTVRSKSRKTDYRKLIMQTKPEFLRMAVNLRIYGMSKDMILQLIEDNVQD